MYTKDEAYAIIEKLTVRFGEQITSYKKADYNETLVRRDFIDPFFKALGWDVDNSQGNAEAYREVIHEDRIKVGGATKAPDYSFRLPGGKRLFFVEAKKPSVAVKTDIVPAYQVRRYAWSAKLPISLLTDFEELAVYDCNKKPRPEDKASAGRIAYLTYDKYLAEFDFLWNTFSKERVLKGSFDKYIAADTAKRGTTTVDKDFLQSLDEWRIQLAQNIAARNEALTEDELNFTVQQTLDRIIFLRIAEDRGVEEYGRMKEALKGDSFYASLFTYFKEADDKYNSGLFDFKKDRLSRSLIIDNKVLKSIITNLYYPASPYEFSVLSVEILGSAYEQFLGKQITLTSRHKAEIEEKPEVRKAGGVYYTPQYIVSYIVEQTIGRLTEGKSPAEVAKLKIVDPACGSGSFLIGAYESLLKWHRDYYRPDFTALSDTAADTNLPTKQREAAIRQRSKLPLTPDGNLTTALKKQILINNIFGVDIDTQAVEVTKLSLLLKCMEGETKSSMTAEMSFGERVLPTLDGNIKSGNSLIDLDFYDGTFDFEAGAEKKVKPFSWQLAFLAVFTSGGFDAVIGNPPYIRVQLLNEIKETLGYYSRRYKAATVGSYDLYVLFIEKALRILKTTGMCGYILPHKFFNAKYGLPIRKLVSEGKHLEQIIHFGDQQVFRGATTYSCLLFMNKKATNKFSFSQITDLQAWQLDNKNVEFTFIDSKTLSETEWNLSGGNQTNLYNKLNLLPVKLGQITKIFVGLQTSADTVFLFKNSVKANKELTSVYSKELNEYIEIETELLKDVIRSGEIGRYWSEPSALVLFPYTSVNGKAELIKENEMRKNYPHAWKYLNRNKSLLEERENGKFKFSGWYQLYPKNLNEWEEPKIMLPYMIKELGGIYDTTDKYFVNVTTGGFGLRLTDTEYKPIYVLALLNSNVLNWFLKRVSTNFNSGYFAANKQFLVQLPIKKASITTTETLIKLANDLTNLYTLKQPNTLPEKLEQLQQRINYTDNQINKLIYELYELTDEEIAIVEIQ